MSKTKKCSLSSTSNVRTYLLDLTAPVKQSLNIGNQWIIKFPPPSSIMGFPIAPRIKKNVRLKIQDLKLPSEHWDVNSKELIKVIFGASTCYLHNGNYFAMSLTESETYFQLQLNTAAIKDCKQVQQTPIVKYEISFKLVLADNNDKVIVSKDETLYINFNEVHTTPLVEFANVVPPIKYMREIGKSKIATLVVKNPSMLNYFPPVDVDMRFCAMDGAEVLPSDWIWIDAPSLQFSSLEKSQEKRLDVYMDIEKFGNPYGGKRHITLLAEYSYCHSNNQSSTSQALPVKAEVIIEPNLQEPELIVLIKEHDSRNNEEPKQIKNGDTISVSNISFIPGTPAINFMNQILLQNTATEGLPGTGVHIKEMSYKVDILPTYANITYSNRQTVINDAFPMCGYEPFAENGCKLISEANKNSRCVKVGFSSDKIINIYYEQNGKKHYDVNVAIKVSFKYCIDNIGTITYDSEWCDFDFTIQFNLLQLPYPKWLGIDFGTSAIVSKMSGGEVHDLRAIKSEIYKPVDDDPDMFELGTRFLSSNIIFRNNATYKCFKCGYRFSVKEDFCPKCKCREPKQSQLITECSELPFYHSLALCLSPSSQQYRTNSAYVLPCLKLLMGYKTIPNIENYSSFKYNLLSNDTVELTPLMSNEEGFEAEYSPLAYVQKIFEEVYRVFFNYYIKKSIPKDAMRKMNKIVLTVPNTYTPIHLALLREIIEKSLPELNIRNIKFVSESDSVACYYMNNWDAITTHLNRSDRDSLNEYERVLIFDMGAGTLDATLFEKKAIDVNNGKYEINILGKIGLCKAGNYLDSVIAQILAGTYPCLSPYLDSSSMTDDVFEIALRLKEYIKNEIKPALSKEDAVLTLSKNEALSIGFDRSTIEKLKGVVKLDVRELIVNHPHFKDYIKDCTSKFLDNFFTFLQRRRNEMMIHTVILSGRSAKLMYIKEGLKEALRSWVLNTDTCYVDLAEINLNRPQGADLSKTVVVEGALSYASLYSDQESQVQFNSPNIMANYGVIYNDVNGAIKYQELLNPRTEQAKDEFVRNGMTIRTYKTEPVTLNMAASDYFVLVQTYSSNTARDWNNGNKEYITEINRYSIEGQQGRSHMQLNIEVDENNTLILGINGATAEGTAPSRVDVNSISNQMSLWPLKMH